MELSGLFANNQQKQVEKDRKEIYVLATKFNRISSQNNYDFASNNELTFVKDIGVNKTTLLIEFFTNNGNLKAVINLLKALKENNDLHSEHKFQINSQIGKTLLSAGYFLEVAKMSEVFPDLDPNEIFETALSKLTGKDYKQIEKIIIHLPYRSLSVKNLHKLVDLGLSNIAVDCYFKFKVLDEYLAQNLLSTGNYKSLVDHLAYFSNLSATTAKKLITNGYSKQFANYLEAFTEFDIEVLEKFIIQNGYQYSYDTKNLTKILIRSGVPVFDTLNKLLADDTELKMALGDLNHLDISSTSQILKRFGPKYIVSHLSQFESFDRESLDGIMSTVIEHSDSTEILKKLLTKGLDATFLKEYFEKNKREDLLIKNLELFVSLNPKIDVNLIIQKLLSQDSHNSILRLIDSNLELLLANGLDGSKLFEQVYSFFKKRSIMKNFSEIYTHDYELLAKIFVKSKPISVPDPELATINHCLETLYKICVEDNNYHNTVFIRIFAELFSRHVHTEVSFDQILILINTNIFSDLAQKDDTNGINWLFGNSGSINNIQDASYIDDLYKKFGNKYLAILEKGFLKLSTENRDRIIAGLDMTLSKLGVEPTQDQPILSDWVIDKILSDEKFFPTISRTIKISSTNSSKIEKIGSEYGNAPECFEQLSEFVSLYKSSKNPERFAKELKRVKSVYHSKFVPDKKFEKLLHYLKAFETDRVYFNNPKYKKYFERKIENLYIHVLDKINDIPNIDEYLDTEILEMSKIASEIHRLSENDPGSVTNENVDMFFRIYSNEPKEFATSPTLLNTQTYNNKFIKIVKQNNQLFETINCLPSNQNNRFTRDKILKNYELLSQFEAVFLAFKKNRIAITEDLLNFATESQDPESTFKEWREIIRSFDQGNFDSTDPLHQNLEYTRFKNIVDHPKISGYIKSGATFAEYLKIYSSTENQAEQFTEADNFEIECLLEEVKLLKNFIFSLKDLADSKNKELWVVPNLSYGYLPTSIITKELQDRGIKVIFGLKVGSTESHNNKEVLNNQLFKGYRTNIINKDPMIVVIDGTKNIQSNDKYGAKYPDSYQGYLNQMIVMNDALGFNDEDYTYAGKSATDLERLRNSQEYKELYNVFRSNIAHANQKKTPYKFNFWNTAKLDLSIIGDVDRVSADTLSENQVESDNLMYFCNVGLLDSQIPNDIKLKYPGYTHTPAAFDDSGRIVKLSFYYDNYGIHYSNALEEKAREFANNQQIESENRSFCYLIECLRQIQKQPFLSEAEASRS